MYYEHHRYIDKVCVVTGAANGLGLSLCTRLLEEGAYVGALDIEGDTLKKVFAGKEDRLLPVEVDVASKPSVDAAINAVIERFGHIDVLFNNAGIIGRQSLLDSTEEQWRRVIDVNLNGTFFCAQAVLRHMVDKGIKDANNMGAAMAPAAYSTLKAHFEDTALSPDYYDLIVTGDLGKLGHEIVCDFFAKDGVELANYNDCGLLLFDREEQDVHAGASGCGCSASVLCGFLLPGLLAGRWKRILFCPTGALHSPTATMQGESIPGICHAIALEGGK